MSVAGVTCGRTIGRLRSQISTSLSVAVFLAVVALLFSLRLEATEGGALSALEVWALCASQVLPLLTVCLGLDVWSEERRSGRMSVLLSTAVLEKDLVFGKFLGVWILSVLSAVFSLFASMAMLRIFSPAAATTGFALFPAFLTVFGLAVQAVLWASITLAVSAFFEQAAASFCVAAVLTVALPRGLWFGLMSWSARGRAAFGPLPFDAHILDMTAGLFPVGTLFCYFACSLAFLFLATKAVALSRLVGRGGSALRASTVFAMVLALVAACLTVVLTSRLDYTLDIPASGASVSLSSRTRGILAETTGKVTVTCFLSRQDAKFRPLDRFLRLLKRESSVLGGAQFTLRYVDPHWDIGAAERLVGRGVAGSGLVFERGRRLVFLSIEGDCGERACATAIRRLASATSRRTVYWTTGHGEGDFDEYGLFGTSDIARDAAREGYLNSKIDLSSAARIPGDCAAIVVAGAKEAFSRLELGRLDAYLKEGGRLLVLSGPDPNGGMAALLPAWGIRPTEAEFPSASTASGSDVLVSDFPDNAVTARLRGSRLVLEKPVSFQPSAAAEALSGADRILYTPIAVVGDKAVAVLSERGTGAGSDLTIRPTRLIAVGDASFIVNGPLAARANANRDFFLNCLSYLSGSGAGGAPGAGTKSFSISLDRRTRLRHVLGSAVGVPLGVFLILTAVALRRRRRR